MSKNAVLLYKTLGRPQLEWQIQLQQCSSKAEISLQQAQMEVTHSAWWAAVGTAGEGKLHH